MGFNFEEVDTEDRSSFTIHEYYCKRCDIMLFPPICQDIAPDILEKYRYLEKLGYFIQGFYMLNPFYYLGSEENAAGYFNNGTAFLKISDCDDLENLDLGGRYFHARTGTTRNSPKPQEVNLDILDYSQVVLFRHGPVKGFEYPKIYTCVNDLVEFIGVFKAVRKDVPGKHVYKMIKLYDRYYFDSDKWFESTFVKG